jgi:glutathione S-transferase
MKLFYAPNTRAECVRWLLDEMMVDYDIVFVNFAEGEHKSDFYKTLHPLGQLPALEDEGNMIIERAAIMLHLVDRFRAKNMAPVPGSPERGAFYQLMVFAVATLEPAAAAIFQGSDEEKAEARTRLDEIITIIENSIAGPWLFGAQFTAADCLIGSQMIWAFSEGLLEGHDKLINYTKALAERPAYRQVPTDFPTTEQ